MKQLLLVTFLLVSTLPGLLAQDVIYTANGNRLDHARLIGVTEDRVSFDVERPDKTSQYSFQRQNVLIAFNKNGNFLIISDLGSDLTQAEQRLQAYKTAPPRTTATDYLIKAVPLTVIPAEITYESESIINYRTAGGKSASIPKVELVAVLYRDGRHALIRQPDEAAPLLSIIEKQLKTSPSVPDTKAVIIAAPAVQVPEPVKEETAAESASATANGKQKVTLPATIPDATASSVSLSEADYQFYRKKALQRVDKFVSYLNIITNKSLSTVEKDKAIDQAIQLFMPAATIEVTSKNQSGSRRYPLRAYLSRLKLLPYSSAKIDWSEVQYIKEMSQAADGNYYGVIAGQQTFVGYGSRGDDVIYSDVTPKRVRVKLERSQMTFEGTEVARWNLLLGNIGVAAN